VGVPVPVWVWVGVPVGVWVPVPVCVFVWVGVCVLVRVSEMDGVLLGVVSGVGLKEGVVLLVTDVGLAVGETLGLGVLLGVAVGMRGPNTTLHRPNSSSSIS